MKSFLSSVQRLISCCAYWSGLWIVSIWKKDSWEAFGRLCLRAQGCVTLTSSEWGVLAVKIPAGFLLGTLWVGSKSSPVLPLSPTGDRAAAAPWLPAGACWLWVLVHLPQREAPEQSLCLLAAGKEGDLYCRQAQVPSCISLKKILARKGVWEGCSDRSLCFVLFLLFPFLTS